MAVTVDGAPLRMPLLRNMHPDDRAELLKYLRDINQRVTQLRERTGGTGDAVASAQSAAQSAAADTTAISSGADTATLVPSNPLSYTTGNAQQSTIMVAGHTRSGAGAALVAGNVATAVERDRTHYVYYDDAGNAGGTQTFLSTEDNSILSAAGRRYIGSIYIPPSAYGDREISLL